MTYYNYIPYYNYQYYPNNYNFYFSSPYPVDQRPDLPESIKHYQAMQLISFINFYRQRDGKSPVHPEIRLEALASEKSRDMALFKDPSHYSPRLGGDEGAQLKKAGINKLYAANIYYEKPRDPHYKYLGFNAVYWWLNSPGHKRNMFDPNMKRVGASYTTADDGVVYWSLILTA